MTSFFSFVLPHPSVASPVPSLVLPGPAVILLSLVSYSLSSFVIWPLPSFPSVLFVICWSNAYLYFTINFVVSRVLRHSLSLNPLQNSSPFILPDSRVVSSSSLLRIIRDTEHRYVLSAARPRVKVIAADIKSLSPLSSDLQVSCYRFKNTKLYLYHCIRKDNNFEIMCLF